MTADARPGSSGREATVIEGFKCFAPTVALDAVDYAELRLGVSRPFGGSLVAVARKPGPSTKAHHANA